MSAERGTIDDFAVQWSKFTDNSGFYGSVEMLEDLLGPLVDLDDLSGQAVADVGSGSGRYLPGLARTARRVYGIEPGDGVINAREYTRELDNVELVHSSIYEVDAAQLEPLDHAFSFGVIHHLPDPDAAVRKMVELTKPGGRVTIWVYGKEGNELYLATFGRAMRLTSRLPHPALNLLSAALTPALWSYVQVSKRVPAVPMGGYMSDVLGKLTPSKLKLNIYDQLNPKIAHYWTGDEVRSLMERAGLTEVELYHRHGYSWTATGRTAG